MNHSQFMRIERRAGGVAASNRAFIRVAHSVLTDDGKSRDKREWRHQWLRKGLALSNQANQLASLQEIKMSRVKSVLDTISEFNDDTVREYEEARSIDDLNGQYLVASREQIQAARGRLWLRKRLGLNLSNRALTGDQKAQLINIAEQHLADLADDIENDRRAG